MERTKAKATGFKVYGKHSTIIEYEYRGYKYEVEFPNDISYWITAPKVQHELEQEKIDKMIDTPKTNSGEDAEVGFELFWRYVNGED